MLEKINMSTVPIKVDMAIVPTFRSSPITFQVLLLMVTNKDAFEWNFESREGSNHDLEPLVERVYIRSNVPILESQKIGAAIAFREGRCTGRYVSGPAQSTAYVGR